MTTERAPRSPAGLGPRGRKFWRETVSKYELSGPEFELLAETCRVLDRIAELDALVAEQGAMVPGSAGQPVLHPAISEARQQRLVLSRLVRQLALPDETDPAVSLQTEQKRYAAQVRWGTRG